MKNNLSPTKKRELIIQALYQKKITGDSNTNIIRQFKSQNKNYDLKPMEETLKKIKPFEEKFTSVIAKHSNIAIERIGGIELSILIQALYEINETSLDKPIIINEAIKLAKKFGQNSSHRFVNAILDRYIKN